MHLRDSDKGVKIVLYYHGRTTLLIDPITRVSGIVLRTVCIYPYRRQLI